MARINLHDTQLDHAGTRRAFLRHSTTLALAACTVGVSPLSWAAQRAAPTVPVVKAGVYRWDGADYLPDLDHVRAGWMPPCASLIGVDCPVGLPSQLSLARAGVRSEPARQKQVRLVGYDGASGVPALRLDALFPLNGRAGALPFGWADVRNDRVLTTPAAVTTWSSNGMIPLQIAAGGKGGSVLPVQIPSQAGVYLVLVDQQAAAFDLRDLFFREQEGGGFHRRLTDAYGAPLQRTGYFVFVVQDVGR